jgi:hypothetical protein
MSPRSLLFAALLLAVLAAAQFEWQSDMLISTWSNMSATKMCATDAPSRCYFVPKLDFAVDPTKTLLIVTYQCGTSVCNVANPIGDYLLLRYIFTATKTWYIIDIPRGGLLYSPNPFKIGPVGSNMQVSATSYTVCGKTYNYAYYASAGSYNITPLQPPYYIVDINNCFEYRIVAPSGAVVNITTGWFSLYLAELMPYTRKIFYSNQGYALNGTLHAYFTYFHAFLNPMGSGFYIMGPRVSMTLVMPFYYYSGFYSFRGPVAFDVWSDYWLYGGAPGDLRIAYNIGPPPGDGFMMAVLAGTVASGGARLAYVSENATGYFVIQYPSRMIGAGYVTFQRRYAVVDVTLADNIYIYNTRGIACPIAYYNMGWFFNRLDRSYEVEVCNNRTDAVYVTLGCVYLTSNLVGGYITPGFYRNMYGDLIAPGKCVRLRWDSAIASDKPCLQVYKSAQDVCAYYSYVISTTNYNPGWRHFLFQNNTLKAVAPIAPDYDFPSLLKQLVDLLGWQYKNVLGNYSKWYATQRNATQTNATQAANLTSFFASQLQFLGTIKMDSSTSTWLRTTLNELQKLRVVGTSASSFGAVSIPTVPTAVAPAAAAAVAVAWAASRRDDDVATTVAVAGIALALFGILMTLVYGTSSLTLVALGIIAAAAAAAWKKI